jgi:hypothetical protein
MGAGLVLTVLEEETSADDRRQVVYRVNKVRARLEPRIGEVISRNTIPLPC